MGEPILLMVVAQRKSLRLFQKGTKKLSDCFIGEERGEPK